MSFISSSLGLRPTEVIFFEGIQAGVQGEPSAILEAQFRADQAYEFSRLCGRGGFAGISPYTRICYIDNQSKKPTVDRSLSERVDAVLRDTFKLNGFRPGQRETIEAILRRQDSLTILPTGSGKSLCYQLPSLLLEGLTIVVTPLIALMEDQVSKLGPEFRAACVHSGMKKSEQERVYDRVKSRHVKLLYVSPEQLGSKRFFDHVSGRSIDLLAIDEAHCVSSWGHDFRPSYLSIGRAREVLRNPPLALFTATATPQTRADMKNILGLAGCFENVAPASRDNLSLKVEAIGLESDKPKKLLDLLKQEQRGATLVYCATTITVDQISEFLGAQGISHRRYHAQMPNEEKAVTFIEFTNGTANVIICTKAFGMGIDRPDVRRVIHYEMPGSLEDYCQEVGRAGRDGDPAEGILLFHAADVRIQTHFVFSRNPQAGFIRHIYKRLREFAVSFKHRPPTPAQLQKRIEYHFYQMGPLLTMAQAAYAFLVEYGYILIEGDEVSFPLEETPTINDQLVDDKRMRVTGLSILWCILLKLLEMGILPNF